MHMADALLSPQVGGAMWAATAAVVTVSSRRVRAALDDRAVPLMGVLGAFVFAAQMINFTIPGTGSSGHLGGGLLLAILLGPGAAFLTLASVLTVQALFFADGGLLALGANIFNLGFFPCFVAYPLLYRPLAGPGAGRARMALAAVVASVVGLQLGSLGVVAQTVLSGVSELPFASFALLMQSIHLAIGVGEGVVTAGVVGFVAAARPEILAARGGRGAGGRSLRGVALAFGAAALVVGGGLSWFASSRPDGLEWALARSSGSGEPAAPAGSAHGALNQLQEKTAVLPDYGFREAPGKAPHAVPGGAWPAVDPGTSAAGVVGGLLTLAVAAGAGYVLRRRARQG
ncbi:MAG: energy-coupling factor ABC transporter permease [Deferrisomatales bacterium]